MTERISRDATTISNVGLALADQGEYARAISYYDEALAITLDNVFAIDDKGLVLINLGNYAEAIPYFDKALSIDQNNKHDWVSNSLYGLGNYA